MEINFNETKAIWDNFVLSSPQKNIFIFSDFLDSLQHPYSLVTLYDNGQIVAGVPVMLDAKRNAFTALFPFTQYQGVIVNTAKQKLHSRITLEFKILTFFIAELVKKYGSMCLCQSWKFEDMRPFQWYNYHAPENGTFEILLRYTGILDLSQYSNFDEYLRSVRTLRRREFNKAKETVEFRWGTDIEELCQIHGETFSRQGLGRSAQEVELVKSISRHALEHGYGKLAFACVDGRPVSATLFLYDGETAYYLFGANRPEYRNSGASTFLMLNMLKDAFDISVKDVDFVGVNSPSRGDYKISYGAALKPFFIARI